MKPYNRVKKLQSHLITKERNSGDKFVCLDDTRKDWMQDAAHDAHGDSGPDDTIYNIISDVCGHIVDTLDEDADYDDMREAVYEMEPDVYTSDLTKWLNSRLDHVYYLTEVLEEGYGITDGFQLLAMAQQKQIIEVGSLLLDSLESMD